MVREVASHVEEPLPLCIFFHWKPVEEVVESPGHEVGNVLGGRPILELVQHGLARRVLQPVLDELEPSPELDQGCLGDDLTRQTVDEIVFDVSEVTGEGLRVPEPLVDVFGRVGDEDGLTPLPLLLEYTPVEGTDMVIHALSGLCCSIAGLRNPTYFLP